jgi:putative sigma-54 modulation protein
MGEMRVLFRSISVAPTKAMAEHVERTVSSAMAHRREPHLTVHVRLRDLNGPKGGADQEVVVIERSASSARVARAVSEDAYVAVSLAVERLNRQGRAARRTRGRT